MRKAVFYKKTSLLIVVLAGYVANAQLILTQGLKDSIINGSLKQINEHYYFGKEATEITKYVKAQQKKKTYTKVKDFGNFIQILAQDIQHINHDKHLNFIFTPSEYVKVKDKNEFTELLNPAFLNGGITSLKILPGNIGYMDISVFGEQDEDAVAGAFAFLKNTSALIIDLRKNGGGQLSNLISSYLLPAEKIHLNTIFWKDRTEKIYTRDIAEYIRYAKKPVYLLTSQRTFSSAEEFAYDLKNLKRAILVGETTGGGANPGQTFEVLKFKDGSLLELFVPTGKVENPISKTNWEGKGVAPDISCDASDALIKSQQSILEMFTKENPDEDRKKIYQELIGKLDNK